MKVYKKTLSKQSNKGYVIFNTNVNYQLWSCNKWRSVWTGQNKQINQSDLLSLTINLDLCLKSKLYYKTKWLQEVNSHIEMRMDEM